MSQKATAATAAKEQFATSITKGMKRQKVSQSELARRMGTSRAVVHRMLKPGDVSMTLVTMGRAADALGMQLRFQLVR